MSKTLQHRDASAGERPSEVLDRLVHVKHFLKSCTFVASGSTFPEARLMDVYREWCHVVRVAPLPARSVRETMIELGFTTLRCGDQSHWVGIVAGSALPSSASSRVCDGDAADARFLSELGLELTVPRQLQAASACAPKLVGVDRQEFDAILRALPEKMQLGDARMAATAAAAAICDPEAPAVTRAQLQMRDGLPIKLLLSLPGTLTLDEARRALGALATALGSNARQTGAVAAARVSGGSK